MPNSIENELVFFVKCLGYLKRLSEYCHEGARLLHISEGSRYYFTVVGVDVDRSGCGSCHAIYPTMTITGKLENETPYVGHMDAWDLYPCCSEDVRLDDDMMIEEPGMFFRLFVNDNYDQQEHLWLEYKGLRIETPRNGQWVDITDEVHGRLE